MLYSCLHSALLQNEEDFQVFLHSYNRLLPQFYVQLLYKPYLRRWTLLFGRFGQVRAVRENLFYFAKLSYFLMFFFPIFIVKKKE